MANTSGLITAPMPALPALESNVPRNAANSQSAVSATEHLNKMNQIGPHPWQVSFSYARALQDPALKAWKGEAGNVGAAQKIFYHRAKMNSAARTGGYTKQMEDAG